LGEGPQLLARGEGECAGKPGSQRPGHRRHRHQLVHDDQLVADGLRRRGAADGAEGQRLVPSVDPVATSLWSMGRREKEEKAAEAAEREDADPLVQLERRLRDGRSVFVDEVLRAWRSTRYPKAMIQMLAQRKRPELAQRAAAAVGIVIDVSAPTWREDLDALLFEQLFGKSFEDLDALADAIRRAVPDPSA
jgi:hypothetical protein